MLSSFSKEVKTAFEQGGSLCERSKCSPNNRADLGVLQIERLEFALNPSVQFLKATVQVSRALIHEFEAESLVFGSKKNLAVSVDLLDPLQNGKEFVIHSVRCGC